MKHIEKYWIFIVITFGISLFIKPAFCFFILGSLFLYIGIAAMQFQRRLQQSGIACTGRIISFEVSSRGNKMPVIEFVPIGGEPIIEKPFIYTSTDLSEIRTYNNLIDKEVVILYDPADPKKFILKDEKGFNYVVFIFALLAGLIFLTVSISSLLGYIEIG